MKGTHSVCDFKKMLWMEMEKEKAEQRDREVKWFKR